MFYCSFNTHTHTVCLQQSATGKQATPSKMWMYNSELSLGWKDTAPKLTFGHTEPDAELLAHRQKRANLLEKWVQSGLFDPSAIWGGHTHAAKIAMVHIYFICFLFVLYIYVHCSLIIQICYA